MDELETIRLALKARYFAVCADPDYAEDERDEHLRNVAAATALLSDATISRNRINATTVESRIIGGWTPVTAGALSVFIPPTPEQAADTRTIAEVVADDPACQTFDAATGQGRR